MRIKWETIRRGTEQIVRGHRCGPLGEIRNGKLYISVTPKKGKVLRFVVEVIEDPKEPSLPESYSNFLYGHDGP